MDGIRLKAAGWEAPGYWQKVDGEWFTMTLGGLRPVDPAAPVCHVSYYEADAFARWRGCRLPSEAEWEVTARAGALADAFGIGVAVDAERLRALSRLPAGGRRAR